MRSFKHWTPRYIFDRLSYWCYRRLNPDAPWLPRKAISFLDSWLLPSNIGFEWGCGKSTLWLARRIKHLTSVEHDIKWYHRVSKELEKARIRNVELIHYPIEIVGYCSQVIYSMPSGGFDFILIDGKMRHACMVASVHLLRPGGLLILDNANLYLPSNSRAPNSIREIHPEYKRAVDRIKTWQHFSVSNGLSDTAFWTKE